MTSEPRVPGVVAMVTDPQRNIYEGAAGTRRLDRDADTRRLRRAQGRQVVMEILAPRKRRAADDRQLPGRIPLKPPRDRPGQCFFE